MAATEKRCAMPLVTNSSVLDYYPGDPCPWESVGEVDGSPLCWVHLQAVRAETRRLDEFRPCKGTP